MRGAKNLRPTQKEKKKKKERRRKQGQKKPNKYDSH